MRRLLAVACIAAAVAFGGSPAAAVAPPANPYLGPVGTATMHGDAASSDTTPNPGPGSGAPAVHVTPFGAACPTILQGADGYVQALCTTIVGRTPTVYLVQPRTGLPLASLRIAKGSLLGGVYAYLDAADRMVVVDGHDDLLRIAHVRTGFGTWQLRIVRSTPLGSDAVTSLLPDYDGNVWFATGDGVAGFAAPGGEVRSVPLGAGEHVDNSISTAPAGVAIATDHALYLVDAVDGAPHVVWRQPYDRGPARKPGQLSWGTGATPTFFGPATGSEYVTITDNAVPLEHLLVYATATGAQVCSVPIFTAGSSGTENSPIAIDGSVYVASTYGYPYPALPADAGPSEPAGAPFVGGMQRIDVEAGGCHVAWSNAVRSAAVPRLSTADGLIYTVARRAPGGGSTTTELDSYYYTVIDATTGAVVSQHLIGVGAAYDTLQTVGTITPGGVAFQGTISGLLRIARPG